MVTRWRGRIHAWRILALMLGGVVLAGCAPAPDPMQTIRDQLFYDGLAAFQEGFYKEAALRWERASHFGDGEAARNLGHLYRQGLGVEQDTAIAVAWYQVAADAGVASAQYNLGMVYLNGGPNFATDRPTALLWLNKAAAAGIGPAKKELERLANEAEPKTEAGPKIEPGQKAESAPATPLPTPAPLPAPPPTPPASPAVTMRVQVGSYQTLKAAEADLARLKRRFDLEFQIVRTRLKDGKPWYRLMASGPEAEVETYCRQAATQRIGCWPGKSKVL